MTLSYWDLISLTPHKLKDIGAVKSVTLKEIDNLPNKYESYQLFIHLFMIKKEEFYRINNFTDNDIQYIESSFSESGSIVTIYDLLISFQNTLGSLLLALNFFFDEEVVFDNNHKIFITYKETKKTDDGAEQVVPVGYITRDNFSTVSSVILQRCAIDINSDEQEEKVFKTEKAKRLWEKIHQPKAKTEREKKLESNYDLANIISALAARKLGLTMMNIWDMTVYNIYDQFNRERHGAVYDISKRSVSTWGDKENHFDVESWFTNNTTNSNK